MKFWNIFKKIIPLIGISLFIYIIIKLDIKEIFNIIVSSNINYLIISVLFTFLLFLTQAFKWWFIARKQNIKVPYFKAIKIDLMSYFYGFITPSKIGSVLRAEYLREYTGNFGKGLSNFVIDKILDLISLFCLAILFLIIFDIVQINLMFFILFLAGFILFFLIFYKKERSRAIIRIFYKRFVPEKMKDKSKELFDNFYNDLPKKRYIVIAFIFNLINWIMTYISIYFVGRAVGIELGFIYFLAILPIATLVAQIPITINGFGTREATMIKLFEKFGIESVKVFSMSLLNIFIAGIIPCIIAIILIFNNKKDENKNEIH